MKHRNVDALAALLDQADTWLVYTDRVAEYLASHGVLVSSVIIEREGSIVVHNTRVVGRVARQRLSSPLYSRRAWTASRRG